MSDCFRNADECVRALERALEQMDTIEIYSGILKLIAEMAVGPDEWRFFYRDSFKTEGRRITKIAATNTALRTSGTHKDSRSAYGVDTISAGQRRTWRIRIDKHVGALVVGVSRNHDHLKGFFINKSGYGLNPSKVTLLPICFTS